MPQVATLPHAPSAHAVASNRRVPVRMLYFVVVLSALGGALAAVLLERIVVASEVTHGIPTATARAAALAPLPADTSVPDASEALAGRAEVIEEPVPSF